MTELVANFRCDRAANQIRGLAMFDARRRTHLLPLSRAWHDGYAAGRSGLVAAANPYRGAPRQALAWLLGMIEGQFKRLMPMEYNAMADSEAKITRLPFDEQAWKEGYIAGRFGASGDTNPYPVGSDKAQAWSFGRAEGVTKPLRLVDGSRPCD